MRNLFAIVAAMLLSVATFAQAPQGFSYQAVVRDAQNAIVANKSIVVKITILQGADLDSATEVYSEQHNVKTNQNGLFTLVVGKGDSAGSFRTVNWSKGNYYIRTKTDYGESTSQLMSVPYALFAENVAPDNIVNVLNNSEVTNKLNFVSKTDIDNFVTSADVTATVNTALASYATTENVNSALANYATTENVNTTVNNSLANYTTAQKLKDTLNAYSTTKKLKDTLAVYAKAEAIPTVPTNVGDFTNNMNYVTQAEIDSRGYLTAGDAGNIELADYYSKTDVDGKIGTLRDEFLIGFDANNHEYEDLGLPSGTLWAKCNVGASQPSETGGYYAWGEAEEKDEYTNANWIFPGDVWTSENDAAAICFGGNWATPNYDQWLELKNNCYFEWTTDYNNTGVAGTIVYKAKNDGDKGKKNDGANSYTPSVQYNLASTHIFLPAVGNKADGYLIKTSNPYMVKEGYYESEFYGSPRWRYCSAGIRNDNAIFVTNSWGSPDYCGVQVRPVIGNAIYVNAAINSQNAVNAQNSQNAVNAQNAVKAQTATNAENFGDMPLKTVKLIIQNQGATGAGTVNFMGHEYVVTEDNGDDIEVTFKLPAYSPVFISVSLDKTKEYSANFRYLVYLNNKSLKDRSGYQSTDMENEIVGPFPNDENTINVKFLRFSN